METVIDQMGRSLAAQWEKTHWDPQAFPALAAQALAEVDPATVALAPLAAWAAHTDPAEWPEQMDKREQLFGQPPVTMWIGPERRFFIDLLVWGGLGTDTSIHDHAFEGAFTTISGSCAHTVYDFHPAETIGTLTLGELRESRKETLQPGQVQQITAGPAFIHQSIHNARPTLTAVIRTPGGDGHGPHSNGTDDAEHQASTPAYEPQCEYHTSGVALRSFEHRDPRRTVLVSTLLRTDPALGLRMAATLAATGDDPRELFDILTILYQATGQADAVQDIAAAAAGRLGTQAAQLLAAAATATATTIDNNTHAQRAQPNLGRTQRLRGTIAWHLLKHSPGPRQELSGAHIAPTTSAGTDIPILPPPPAASPR